MRISTLQKKLVKVSDIHANSLDIARDGDWYILKLHEEIGKLTKAHLARSKRSRHKSIAQNGNISAEIIGQEIADVYAHTMSLANNYGRDIVAEIEKKWPRYLTPTEN